MKIAVYHNLPSGGGKRALYEMTRRLATRHTIDVYTLSCAEHDFCDLRPFAQQHVVTPFKPVPLARRPFGRINQGLRAVTLLRVHRLQKKIAQQIDAVGYDVVFTHNCQFLQCPSVLSFLHTPSVYYCGEPPRHIYEPRLARPYNALTSQQRAMNHLDPLPALYRTTLARLDRKNLQAATCVLSNSAFTRENLYRIYGISAHIGYLGVDAELFHPLALPRKDFILSVGMLNPQKGFDFLMRGLALLDQARRPRLVIVCNNGDEREQDYLTTLAQELQVTVEFRAQIADDELVRLYNQARLCVYTPVMEPFGFVPLEAQACQTPVVGVREGGVRESIIHGETGVLVDREPAALAAAIGELLDRTAEADRLGKNGRSNVEQQWTWATSIKKIEHYLTDTAESTRRGL